MNHQPTQTLDARQSPEVPNVESGRPRSGRIPEDQRRQIADAEVAARVSRKSFAEMSDTEADTISLAWEMTARLGIPWRVAVHRAYLDVTRGRQKLFPQSKLSIDTSIRTRNHPHRDAITSNRRDVPSRAPTPAKQVVDRLDMQQFLMHVSDRGRFILSRMLEGFTPREAFDLLGIRGHAEVWRIRDSWKHFTSTQEPVRTPERIPGLSEMQDKIIRLRRKGWLDRQIARLLGKTEDNVRQQRHAAEKKLNPIH